MADENLPPNAGGNSAEGGVVVVRVWGDISEARLKIWQGSETLKRKFVLVGAFGTEAVSFPSGVRPCALVLGNSRDPKKSKCGDPEELARWLSSTLAMDASIPSPQQLPIVTDDFVVESIRALKQGAAAAPPNPSDGKFRHIVQSDAILSAKNAPAIAPDVSTGEPGSRERLVIERRRARLLSRTLKRLQQDPQLTVVVDRCHRGDWQGVFSLLTCMPSAALELCKPRFGPSFLRDLRPFFGYDGKDRGVYMRVMSLQLGHLKRRAEALRHGDNVAQCELTSNRFRWLRRSLHTLLQAAAESSPALAPETNILRYYTGATESAFATRMGAHCSSGESGFLGGDFAEEQLMGSYANFTVFGEAQLDEASRAVFGDAWDGGDGEVVEGRGGENAAKVAEGGLAPTHAEAEAKAKAKEDYCATTGSWMLVGRRGAWTASRSERVERFRESLKVGEALAASLFQSYYYHGSSNIAVCGYEFNGAIVVARQGPRDDK